MENYKKINLQLFADDKENLDDKKDDTQDVQDTQKTYTQQDIELLKQELEEKHKQELEKAKQESITEAQRLSKLSKEQKQAEEYEKMQKELEQLRQEKQMTQLKQESIKQLQEQNLSDKFVDLVLDKDAQKIKDNIYTLKQIFDEQVQRQVEQRLKGNTPQSGNTNTNITKQSILDIQDDEQRLQAIAQNIHLFN